MYFFEQLIKNYPKRFGTFLALIGVLILTPDTMIMRISNLERWPLMGWRGILMGITLLIIWRFFLNSQPEKEWEETQSKAKAIVKAVQLAQKSLNLD